MRLRRPRPRSDALVPSHSSSGPSSPTGCRADATLLLLLGGLENPLDVREAVKKARSFLEILLQDEGIEDVGLEEVVFESVVSEWKVTIGFTRPWDRRSRPFSEGPKRSYKVVRIADKDGALKSLTDRILPDGTR